MLADDAYQLEAAKTYMVDFLKIHMLIAMRRPIRKKSRLRFRERMRFRRKMDAEENEAAHSGQVQRPFSEETVPASAATVNAVSANENGIQKMDKCSRPCRQ